MSMLNDNCILNIKYIRNCLQFIQNQGQCDKMYVSNFRRNSLKNATSQRQFQLNESRKRLQST